MNFLDILIILGLLFAVYKGYRKGIAASFFKLLGYLCGLLAGILFSEVLAKVLDRSFGLTGKLMPWLGEKAALPASVTNVKIEEIPFDKVHTIVETMPIPEVFLETFTEYFNEIAALPELGITNLGDGLLYMMSNFFIVAISFCALYWVVSHFLGVTIPRWFKKASPGPVTLIDRLGGACFGFAGGLISIAITIGMMIPLAAAGSIQGEGSRGVLVKLSVLYSESALASAISDIIIGIIS